MVTHSFLVAATRVDAGMGTRRAMNAQRQVKVTVMSRMNFPTWKVDAALWDQLVRISGSWTLGINSPTRQAIKMTCVTKAQEKDAECIRYDSHWMSEWMDWVDRWTLDRQTPCWQVWQSAMIHGTRDLSLPVFLILYSPRRSLFLWSFPAVALCLFPVGGGGSLWILSSVSSTFSGPTLHFPVCLYQLPKKASWKFSKENLSNIRRVMSNLESCKLFFTKFESKHCNMYPIQFSFYLLQN